MTPDSESITLHFSDMEREDTEREDTEREDMERVDMEREGMEREGRVRSGWCGAGTWRKSLLKSMKWLGVVHEEGPWAA